MSRELYERHGVTVTSYMGSGASHRYQVTAIDDEGEIRYVVLTPTQWVGIAEAIKRGDL